jgi:hypothetical protein
MYIDTMYSQDAMNSSSLTSSDDDKKKKERKKEIIEIQTAVYSRRKTRLLINSEFRLLVNSR